MREEERRREDPPVVVQLAPLESSPLSLAAVTEGQRLGPQERPNVSIAPIQNRVDAHEIRPSRVRRTERSEVFPMRVVPARPNKDRFDFPSSSSRAVRERE